MISAGFPDWETKKPHPHFYSYCGFWSMNNGGDVKPNEARSHLVYFCWLHRVCLSAVWHLVSRRCCKISISGLQGWHCDPRTEVCVCVCDVYISVMRHCPRRSKRDPNDLCDAKYSSQPRAQVSNGYWRLMVALHASVCVCASACSLNRNIQPLMPRNSLLTGTVSMIRSLLWSKQHVGYCGAELGSVTVNCAAED